MALIRSTYVSLVELCGRDANCSGGRYYWVSFCFRAWNNNHRFGLAAFLRSTQLHTPVKKPTHRGRQKHSTTVEVGEHASAVLCCVWSTRDLLVRPYSSRSQPTPIMASSVWRFVVCWTFSMVFTADGEREHHPLCRTLESEERGESAHFPSAYTCTDDYADAFCTPCIISPSHPSTIKEEFGAVTWWVYRGRHQHVEGPASAVEDHEWVDCADYYAHRGPQTEPDELYGASPERKYSYKREIISTTVGGSRERGSRERKPSAAKGNAQNVPVSQAVRTLRTDDARGTHTSVEMTTGGHETNEIGPAQSDRQRDSLVYDPNATCDGLWLSWPAVQERAIMAGTVLVFDVFSSVGNLFITFGFMIKFARLLELGLILKWTHFPGFRHALNPGEINWDLDAHSIMQQAEEPIGGANATGLHPLIFHDFAMVLSDSQLELLALTLDINETNTNALAAHFQKELPVRFNLFMANVMQKPLRKNRALRTQPCAWNMFLRRSPSMMASLEQHNPWGMVSDASGPRHQPAEYIAWHIRTADGETAKSYKPAVHRYVIQEASLNVCPTYLMATEDALRVAEACHTSLPSRVADVSLYISSNSKPMATDCTLEAASYDAAAGHVDLGLNASDAHTGHSRHPLETALGAFLDFFFLMDSTVIVRTGSSFSGTVVRIKKLECIKKVYPPLPKRMIFTCFPSGC